VTLPAPWSVEEQSACSLAYVYFENESGRRSAAKLLTRDEARRIAANIAKLPELLAANKKRPRRITPGSEWCLNGWFRNVWNKFRR
jgi:hypothetical protein